MHMMEWNLDRQQVTVGVGGFAKLSLEAVTGYGTLSATGQRTDHLDAFATSAEARSPTL